jgi:putative membrane protein
MHDMWGHMQGWGWGSWWVMGLFCLLVTAAVVVLIIWAIGAAGRGRSKGGPPVPKSETPLDILKRRYANGELTDEEYEEKRRRLSQ